MTEAQAKIFELFQELPVGDRRDLLARLSESVEEEALLEDLSADEIAAIDEGLSQMERGEVIDSKVVFDRLAEKFGFAKT